MQLVITEVCRIQPYIFGSNRLRENEGASYLVAQATEGWALQAIGEVTARHNVDSIEPLLLDENRRIEEAAQGLEAEVLYAGGGNLVVLFKEERAARTFLQKLSRKILLEAPGLQLAAVRVPFSWEECLARKVTETFAKLEEKKRSLVPSLPLLGLGVTAACRSTGLPAVALSTPPLEPIDEGEPGRPISAEVIAKLQGVIAARKRLGGLLPPPEGYRYPRDLDHLGRTRGDYSYIAVVHIDGNDLGERKKDVGREYGRPEENRHYIEAMRAFAQELRDAAVRALREVINLLGERLREGKNVLEVFGYSEEGRPVKIVSFEAKPAGDGTYYLPLLPLVYGGDDLTFVADGRLGLSLAVAYMQGLEKNTKGWGEGRRPVTSCAGIAIVKSHFPFAQAYHLAEELCRSAKKYRLREQINGSCLDWHIALSGFSANIEGIRARDYQVLFEDGGPGERKKVRGWLTLRPVTLGENPCQSYRSWEVVEGILKEFRGRQFSGSHWAGRRGKLKALREALRGGPEAVERFLLRYDIKGLPRVDASFPDFSQKGWQGTYCAYLDALELYDWHIPLVEESGQ